LSRRLTEAEKVMRTACFWTGARQTFAAKGLCADDSADLVAVDVEITNMCAS